MRRTTYSSAEIRLKEEWRPPRDARLSHQEPRRRPVAIAANARPIEHGQCGFLTQRADDPRPFAPASVIVLASGVNDYQSARG
jgi:hypothetical protein